MHDRLGQRRDKRFLSSVHHGRKMRQKNEMRSIRKESKLKLKKLLRCENGLEEIFKVENKLASWF